MNSGIERVRALTGVTVPVLGAPMAGIAGGALAAAVSDAGGLGLIGGGYGDLTWIRRQMALAGTSRVGIGLISWSVADRPDVLEAVVSMPIAALCLSFGDPALPLAAAHAAGVLTVCQIQTVDEARHATVFGADLIVAQGHEAGGHGRSGTGVLALLEATIAAVGPVPVAAAGGIATVDDARRVIDAGASAVMLGTRLYATHEALDAPEAKAALVGPGARQTVRTTVFDEVRGPRWPEGYDGRAMVNQLVERWHGRIGGLAAHLADEQARYRSAAEHHNLSTRVVWAGTGVERLGSLASTAQVIEDFARAFTGRSGVPTGGG